MVKNPPANAVDAEACSIPGSGRSPRGGHGNPVRILAWTIPWTEKPGRLQSMGSHKVAHNCSPNTFTFLFQNISTEYIATISNSKFLRTSRLIYSLIKSTHFYLRLVFVLWLFPMFFSSHLIRPLGPSWPYSSPAYFLSSFFLPSPYMPRIHQL